MSKVWFHLILLKKNASVFGVMIIILIVIVIIKINPSYLSFSVYIPIFSLPILFLKTDSSKSANKHKVYTCTRKKPTNKNLETVYVVVNYWQNLADMSYMTFYKHLFFYLWYQPGPHLLERRLSILLKIKILHFQFTTIFDLQRQETYHRACALREDSDRNAHSRSLIRIFTERILASQWCKVAPCGWHWSDCADALLRSLIRVSWAHVRLVFTPYFIYLSRIYPW